MTDEERAEFLGGRRTMQMATHGRDDTIHLVAMWYGFEGGNPAFETFARSQKVANLRRNPNITVLVEDGDTYETLRGVQIVGRAEVIEEGDPRVIDIAESVVGRYLDTSGPDETRAVAEAMANKRVGVVVHPEKTVTWDHNKLGGAY
ncbi:MAG: PPOX class F420-dependent oxidoreductase [Microthrixaceae bacterium]|nr:PPOX class F420-dependent oxidoreductase [Microthrixaceae bacterium]